MAYLNLWQEHVEIVVPNITLDRYMASNII